MRHLPQIQREVVTTAENRKAPGRRGRVWWVLVPAGLTAAAALAQLAVAVMALGHH